LKLIAARPGSSPPGLREREQREAEHLGQQHIDHEESDGHHGPDGGARDEPSTDKAPVVVSV
jgi:hypothetical protein